MSKRLSSTDPRQGKSQAKRTRTSASARKEEKTGAQGERIATGGRTRSAARTADKDAHLKRADHRSFTSVDREQLIAESAYYRAERRSFQPGYELEDWLEAEREVDAMLSEPFEESTRQRVGASP